MNPTGTRLARVQVAGQAGIDRVYADLADAVEAEVWRWSTRDADGGDALPMSARAAILAAVALLLDRTRPALITAVLAARTAARGAALAGQSPLPVDVAEEAAARIEVARTIGGAQPGVLRQLGAVLATGIDADFTAALNEQAYVTSVAEHARNGQRLLQIGVDNGDKRLPDLLQLAFARGVHVQEISVTRPSLGDVFLAYTGRALRD